MGLSSLFHFFLKQKQSNMVSSSTIMPLLRTNTRNVWHKKQKKRLVKVLELEEYGNISVYFSLY